MPEPICNLASELIKCKEWDPSTLHALVQADIPERKYLNGTVPFVDGWELIVNIEVNPHSYADVYIDDTTGLTINLPGTRNTDRLKLAIALAIKVAT